MTAIDTTVRVTRPSADATRERVLAAALDLFSELSFDGATTRDIATRAGVTQPLLNYHFSSKDELWRAAVDGLFAELHEVLTRRADGLRGVDELTAAKLLVREFIYFSASHPQLHRIITQECKTDGPRMDWLVERHIRPHYDEAAALFSRLIVAGLLPDIPVAHLYYILTGAGPTMFVLAPECRRLTGVDPQDPEVIEAHVDAVIAFLFGRERGMKLAQHDGRAVLVLGDAVADVETVSEGRFGSDPMALLEEWDAFRTFAATVSTTTGPLVRAALGNPVPRPRQVFAIGLNYRSHAEESGMALPAVPAVFTKFPSSLAGPDDDITVVGDTVDWEVELVAVLGRRADDVAEPEAWSHIAGVTIGQDISDRHLQFAAGGQFSLGKSRRGYGPVGPWLVTPDELDDPDDIALGCAVNGETVQDARTTDLVFAVPRLIAELSAVLPLLPGDLIFTGTPAGVGIARTPPRFLQSGDVLHSWIDGIGTIDNRIVGAG